MLAAVAAFASGLAGVARLVYVGLSAVWAMVVATAPRWLPQFVGMALLALGVKLVVLDPATDLILGHVQSRFGLLSGTVAEVVYYLNVDDFVTLILSALGVRAVTRVALRKATTPTSSS